MGRKSFVPVPGSLRALRSEAIDLFLEQNAILVLGNDAGRFATSQVETQVADIRSNPSAKELKALISKLRLVVSTMREEFGVCASRSELLEFMAWLERDTLRGQVCYLPKGTLSEYLSLYDAMDFPEHARISVDWSGVGVDYPGKFEVRLLEASLFEDMCAIFNCCREADAQAPRDLPFSELKRKIAVKRHAALKRAAMSAAFYFVEGYINGLATDFMHKNGSSLSDKEKMLLTEWDASKNRYKSVSTRDKLVQYPRIITRAQFPPLDENNCPELAYFVTTAKEFRDAVVHASASLDPLQDYPRKETLFIRLNQREVEKVVDTAVALVRRIEILVHGNCRTWLKDRDVMAGSFPDSVFE